MTDAMPTPTMTDDAISEEMVEAAAKALFADEWRGMPGDWAWEKTDDDDKAYWRKSARAALAAVLPIAVASEAGLRTALQSIRAKVHAHNRGRELSHGLRDEVRNICDQAIAAAIRSGNGGE